jgi:hypothetical protein
MAATPESSPRAHPFAPGIRVRPFAQWARHGPQLNAWRCALLGLLSAAGGARALRAAESLRTLRWARAYDSVPYWQARFRSAGLARHLVGPPSAGALLPLERADVRAHRDALMPHLPRAVAGRFAAFGDVYEGVTSGSTGEPLRFRLSAAAYLSFFPVVDLVLAWYGQRTPRPGAGYVLLDALGHSPEYETWLPLFHGLRFSKITVGRTRWRERLRAAAPAVLTGDPDALSALLSVDVRPRVVLSSAFALPERLHAALVTHLRCPVVEYYSAAELGPLALRCPAGAGWHVLTPYASFSTEDGPADAAGADPEAPSRLFVDDLRNEALFLLRYAVGDRGVVDPRVSPCACGLHTPRLSRFDGRAGVTFGGHGGMPRWDPTRLAPTLGRLPLDEYQLIETGPARVRLVHRGPGVLDERARADLGARLRAVAGAEVRFDFDPRTTPWRSPGEKPRPFVPWTPACGTDVRP